MCNGQKRVHILFTSDRVLSQMTFDQSIDTPSGHNQLSAKSVLLLPLHYKDMTQTNLNKSRIIFTNDLPKGRKISFKNMSKLFTNVFGLGL